MSVKLKLNSDKYSDFIKKYFGGKCCPICGEKYGLIVTDKEKIYGLVSVYKECTVDVDSYPEIIQPITLCNKCGHSELIDGITAGFIEKV